MPSAPYDPRDKAVLERLKRAWEKLSFCCLCPRGCGVNRLRGELGYCRMGRAARVASFGPHHGEEEPLFAWCGSATIFLAGCNLGCVYCQNYDISQGSVGSEISSVHLGKVMLDMQKSGCHNINFVSLSQVIPQILAASAWARGHVASRYLSCTIRVVMIRFWDCGCLKEPSISTCRT